jgi:hypothetical protein
LFAGDPKLEAAAVSDPAHIQKGAIGDHVRKIRVALSGIGLYIAVHEMIHACGLSNSEHTFTGPDADTFTINPDTSAGAFDRPQDDKILLRVSFPNPNVTAPPNFIKKTVADLIRNNWK